MKPTPEQVRQYKLPEPDAIRTYGSPYVDGYTSDQMQAAFAAGLAAQQGQEPVAWMHTYRNGVTVPSLSPEYAGFGEQIVPLYTAPAAQPQQEPVERCCAHDSDCSIHNGDALPVGPCDCSQQFISSTAREPLTDEQMDELVFNCGLSTTARDIARAIEKAHGIGADK